MAIFKRLFNWLFHRRPTAWTWAAVYDNVDDLVTDVALIHDKIHDESIKYTPDRLKVLFRDHIYKPLKVLTTTEEYRAKKWSSG